MSVFDKVREKLLGKVSSDGGTGETDKLDSAQDQPQDDIELCTFVKQKFEESRTQATRIAHEGIWMTNIAYLLGYDSVYYDTGTRQFKPSSNSAGVLNYAKRNRIHSNLILPRVQNRLARMLKAPPRYEVQPDTMSEEDKDAAELALEVLNSIWEIQHVNRKRIDLGMWKQQCGHAYIGICHDDQLGDPMPDLETGETVGYQGGTRVDVVSAFEGFPDPLAKTLEECGYFGRAKVRKLDYFRTHYPERGELVKEEGAWLLSSQYEMRINTLNTVGPASSGTAEQMKNAAIELSYYEKRSRKYPNGRHVIVANGVLLKNDELAVGDIPYAKFDDVVVGGKYYSESTITHVRPLQDQYNRNLIKSSEWVNRLVAGKYIAARGHGIMQEALNDQSGEVLEYDPVPNATEPHAMQIPTIPGFVYDERKEIKGEVDSIMGLSEVSQGRLPSASIPAKGMEILLEQDETRMGIETEQDEHAWARVGQLILKYEAKFAKMPRKLKNKDQNGNQRVRDYTGDELRRNFDVTVVRGSTIPNSKVIHRQEIMNLFQDGLFGNPQDPQVRDMVLGMLQYGDMSKAWQDNRLDKMQIQRDIEQIEEGIAPAVDPKDNHPSHLVEKNRYRKSEKYLILDPDKQALLQANIAQHVQLLMQQTNPQLATPPHMPPPPMGHTPGTLPPPPPPPGNLPPAGEAPMPGAPPSMAPPLGAPGAPPM